MLDTAGFTGKADQVHLQPVDGGFAGLVGIGPASEVTATTVRRAGAALARACSRHARAAVRLPADSAIDDAAARQALAEGVILGGYRYTVYKSAESDDSNGSNGAPKLARVDVVGSTSAAAKEALARGSTIAAGVCVARDLSNEPGGSLTAPAFARKAVAVARKAGLKSKVWTETEIKNSAWAACSASTGAAPIRRATWS